MGDKYRIGIDLGGTNIKVGLVDSQNNILGKKSTKTNPFGRSYQEVIADMAATVKSLLAELKVPMEDCEKMGIGSPGMIDHKEGVVVFAGNFGWVDVPLLREMEKYIPLPLRLANDANVAVLGESVAGAAKGCNDVVMLTLGTGVGGGVVAGGKLQEGGAAGGMELGHMTMVFDGESCTCGLKGCVEAYASATALIRQGKRIMEQNPDSLMWELCRGSLSHMSGKIPYTAMSRGDKAGKEVCDRYAEYVGCAVATCITIWRPEKVLLGGGIANEGDPLIIPVNQYVQSHVFAGERGLIAPVQKAQLGNDAGLIGAASL